MGRSLSAKHSRWMFRNFARMREEVAEAEASGGVVWSELARRFVALGRAAPGLRGGNLRVAWEAVKERKARVRDVPCMGVASGEVSPSRTVAAPPEGAETAAPAGVAEEGDGALALRLLRRRKHPGQG